MLYIFLNMEWGASGAAAPAVSAGNAACVAQKALASLNSDAATCKGGWYCCAPACRPQDKYL